MRDNVSPVALELILELIIGRNRQDENHFYFLDLIISAMFLRRLVSWPRLMTLFSKSLSLSCVYRRAASFFSRTLYLTMRSLKSVSFSLSLCLRSSMSLFFALIVSS